MFGVYFRTVPTIWLTKLRLAVIYWIQKTKICDTPCQIYSKTQKIYYCRFNCNTMIMDQLWSESCLAASSVSHGAPHVTSKFGPCPQNDWNLQRSRTENPKSQAGYYLLASWIHEIVKFALLWVSVAAATAARRGGWRRSRSRWAAARWSPRWRRWTPRPASMRSSWGSSGEWIQDPEIANQSYHGWSQNDLIWENFGERLSETQTQFLKSGSECYSSIWLRSAFDAFDTEKRGAISLETTGKLSYLIQFILILKPFLYLNNR